MRCADEATIVHETQVHRRHPLQILDSMACVCLRNSAKCSVWGREYLGFTVKLLQDAHVDPPRRWRCSQTVQDIALILSKLRYKTPTFHIRAGHYKAVLNMWSFDDSVTPFFTERRRFLKRIYFKYFKRILSSWYSCSSGQNDDPSTPARKFDPWR